MNRTLEEATVKRCHYDTHEQMRRHLTDFVTAYDFAWRLKTLKGLTACEFIRKRWAAEPTCSRLDPTRQMPEPSI